MLHADSFFALDGFAHRDLFSGSTHVWDGLKNLKSYMDGQVPPVLVHPGLTLGTPLAQPLVLHHGILSCSREYEFIFGNTTAGGLQVLQNGQVLRGASVIMAGAMLLGKRIAIGEGVLIESGAMIKEPAIIGNCTEVRQGAYMRGYCLVGERCVVGHATEVKHSVFLDDAKAGHFAYLGDSILGNLANLGAGTKFANLRFLGGNIQIRTPDGPVDTGMRKFGAILGDGAQTGCNSVTNPGTLLGPEAILMPNTTAPSGLHPGKTVIR
jgi:bifunctional N-acetylglucosamine-1-phosphate-uridyltransferase/glucosamine-1-phosphate-acetyltransferase GlmU-like protein